MLTTTTIQRLPHRSLITPCPRKQSGFTLVELLLVIVIIAILAAITIVAFNGIQDRARASAVSAALNQASKKLELYSVDNGGYPATLSDAGVTDSNNVSYQYTASTAPSSTYCTTATLGSTSYYISNTTKTPTKGGCPGHGQGGVAAVTNYYTNPKPNSTTGWWPGSGSNAATFSNNVATWSLSGRANRMTWTVVTNNDGGPIISLSAPYAPYAGSQYTIATKLRLTDGAGGIPGVSIDRNNAAGVISLNATSGAVSSMSLNQTYNVYATFTADSAAANNGLRLYIGINGKIVGTAVDFADIDLYPGSYNASRQWHDGSSPNWVWNGAANASTSTGPPL